MNEVVLNIYSTVGGLSYSNSSENANRTLSFLPYY